jgi:DnaK suppressor protein
MQLQTQTHLHMLRDLLNYRLADLQADIHAAETARRERNADPTEVSDRKDEAALNQALSTDDAQDERDRAELRQVEAALHRLGVGTYGDCADCDEAIDMKRLLAQPAAERCSPCQTALELRQQR